MTPYLIMGVLVALNLILIIWKFNHNRTMDALLDASLLLLVGYVFMNSLGALIMGTMGSFIVSLYLLISNPFKDTNGNT